MKYLGLVLANVRRKKTRTLLTVGSFAVALFLFGLLAAIHFAFYQGVEVAGADRLVVINRVSIIQPLPVSYRERLLQLAGVQAVTSANWFGGVYQDERNFFPQYAVDHESYRGMFSEFVIPDEQWQAFAGDRQGCVVGAALAQRYGWKLGDRIPIRGTIFPGIWEFNVRAIYRGSRPGDDEGQFWFRRDYLEERGPEWIKGLVGWYIVRVGDGVDAAAVSRAIDERFANSPFETKTEPERAFAASFAKQMGNIEALILIIGGVVFFTLLLVTGNTQALSVRERTTELAVLKTLGFSDRFALLLVLSESVLVAGVGGLAGITAAKLVTPALTQALPGFTVFLPTWDLVVGLFLALLVGLAAGLLPAVSAMRLRVVDALRRV